MSSLLELIQHATSRARMDSGNLTMFRCLQVIIGGVVSREFVEKYSVPTSIFRDK